MTDQTHFIAWTHERDHISGKAICTADEGSACRLSCNHGCESWTVERDDAGVPFHRTGHFDDDNNEIRHVMSDQGYCNVVEFLNDDDSLLSELNTGTTPFVIGTVAIEEQWEGDYYSWKRAES